MKSGIEMAGEKQILHLRHIWLRFATLKEIGNEKYFPVPAISGGGFQEKDNQRSYPII